MSSLYQIKVHKNKTLPWTRQRYHWTISRAGNVLATSDNYRNYADCREVAYNLHKSIKLSIFIDLP